MNSDNIKNRTRKTEEILHVSYSMDIGGAERALFQLIRGQSAAGLRPSLAVLTKAGTYADRLRAQNITVFELRQKGPVDYRITPDFLEILHKQDCVHFHTQSPVLFYALGKHPIVASAYTHRGGELRVSPKRRLMHYVSGKLISRNISAVSGNTMHALKCARREYGIRHSEDLVTYNGIDFALLKPDRSRVEVLSGLGERSSDAIWRIGTSANLRSLKRTDLLVRAIAALPYQNIRCYIIGDGPDKTRLQELAVSLGASEKIVFVGKQEQVGDYLQILDAFALLSGQAESFGNSVVEAMGLGIPSIIMADGGGMLEHFPNWYMAHPKNLDELVYRIEFMYLNRDQCLSIARRCKVHVKEKYTIEAMVDSYHKLYETAKNQFEKQMQ